MVERQLRARGIDDEHVLEAMAKVPRELFVPEGERARSYEDAALPIGEGQTISQPYMVALICGCLQLHGGERVLDVGNRLRLPGGRARGDGRRRPLHRARSGARGDRPRGARRRGIWGSRRGSGGRRHAGAARGRAVRRDRRRGGRPRRAGSPLRAAGRGRPARRAGRPAARAAARGRRPLARGACHAPRRPVPIRPAGRAPAKPS